MYIAIIGNGFFGPLITKHLQDFDRENVYRFFNTSEKKSDKLRFFSYIAKADLVYVIGGYVKGGGALALAMFLRKSIVQHFIGTDVLKAIDNYKKNNVSQRLVGMSTYLCVVDWNQDELKEIDIHAEVAPLAIYEPECVQEPIGDFSVLTYVARGREEFYGIDAIFKLAGDFPDVNFRIAGITGCKNRVSSNVEFLGWVDMREEYRRATCFLRAVQHDGLPFSVIEALSHGRTVFYNRGLPNTIYFSDYNELSEGIKRIKAKYERGELNINYEGIKFVEREFNKDKVLSRLINILKQAAGR